MTNIRAALLPLAAILAGATAPQSTPTTDQDGYGNAYPADEVFARIARHAPPYDPSQIAYEDRDVIVFADHAPLSPGHMLVVARHSRARSLIDIPPATLARLMAVARRVMIAQRDALGATGAMVMISNGSWQAVPHLHVHVIPRYAAARVDLGREPQLVPATELAAMTAKLAQAMRHPRP